MKIEENKIPRIGIVGGFQYGKSTLINCLLQDRVAISGVGIATTKQVTRYYFAANPILKAFKKNSSTPYISKKNITRESMEDIIKESDISFCEIGLPCPLLMHIELWDTPGFNANDRDNEVTSTFFEKLDYAFVLISGDLTQPDIETLHLISNNKVPYTVLYNSKDEDRWEPGTENNKRIRNNCIARMKQLGFGSSISIPGQGNVFAINTAWSWYDIVRLQKKTDFMLSAPEGEDMLFRRIGNFLAFQNENKNLNLRQASNVDILRDFLNPTGITFGNLHTQLDIYKEIFNLQKTFEDFTQK